jgi:hypothetical protein
MIYKFLAAAVAVVVLLSGLSTSSQARILCNGAYQVVRGAGEIATPFCEDQYLAKVARRYGVRVSGSQIRRSPNRKEEVCRMIGHDSRVYDICLKYQRDSCSHKSC